MVDKSKDTKILNTLHASATDGKLAHADEIYLDSYTAKKPDGSGYEYNSLPIPNDNLDTAIGKLSVFAGDLRADINRIRPLVSNSLYESTITNDSDDYLWFEIA